MCQACQDISLSRRNTAPHPELAYQGFNTPVKQDRGIQREELYCCKVCHTRWVREIDRWGTDLGFKLGT